MTEEDVRRWVEEGHNGKVMCTDCRYAYGSPDCFGCPIAWRKIDGRTEHYREPIHGLPEEM